jgi:hypothetical protein
VEGVDRRAVFFGLSKEQYDSAQWIPTSEADEHNNSAGGSVHAAPKATVFQGDTSDWNSELTNGKEWIEFIAALRPIKFSIQKNPRNKDNMDKIIEDFDNAKCKDNYKL